MSASALEVKGKREKETQSQEWVLIQGDLEKLNTDENSDEIVIFEKAVFAGAASSAAGISATESKKIVEANKMKALQLVFCRREKMSFDLATPKRITKATGKRPTSLFILLGDGTLCGAQHEGHLSWDHLNTDFREEIDNSAAMPFHVFMENMFDMYPTNTDYMKDQQLKKLLKKEGSPNTDSFLGLRVGEMNRTMIDAFFDVLVNKRIITATDAAFLQNMVEPRNTSEEETLLRTRIQNALDKKDFKAAVEAAQQLHKLSRKEAFERGSTCYQSSDNNKIHKLQCVDDCDAAFEVANILESVSPLDAISLLQIFVDYELNENAYDAFFSSPYTNLASDKISDIKMNMMAHCTSETESRKLRKEAIKSCFHVVGSSESPEMQSQAFSKFLKLLDAHCGFESVDPKQSMFKDVTNIVEDEMHGMNSLMDIILTMSDKIYDLQQGTKKDSKVSTGAKPQSQKGVVVSKGDSKSQAEVKAGADSVTAGSAASASKTAAAPLTYLKDAQRVRSLDDDIEDLYSLDDHTATAGKGKSA